MALPAALAVVALALYVTTMPPGLTWRHDGDDGGDLIAAARTLGVPHPTGYPTYVLLAHLFTRLPFGSVAFRVGLLSAVSAAATVALTYFASLSTHPPSWKRQPVGVLADAGPSPSNRNKFQPPSRLRQWGERLLASLCLGQQGGNTTSAGLAALALAVSPTFWSQAIIAEVYALHVLCVAAVLYLLLLWRALRPAPGLRTSPSPGLRLRRAQSRRRDEGSVEALGPKAQDRARGGGAPWLPWLAAGVCGLGLGNHLTLTLLAPAVLLLLWPHRARWWRWRVLVGGIAALALGLVGSLYLPLRAAHHPAVNWGDPQTWPQFWWLVLGVPYRRFLFALPLHFLPARLAFWAQDLVRQFGWWGVPLGLMGLAVAWREDRSFALSTTAYVLLVSAYAIGYGTTDSYVYLIPAYLVFALWLGRGVRWGLGALGQLNHPRLRRDFGEPRPEPGRRRRLSRAVGPALFAAGLLLLLLFSVARNLPALDLSADREAHGYGTAALSGAEPGALVIAESDGHTFALWYFRYAEGMRPDVAVLNGSLISYRWYRENLRWVHPQIALFQRGVAPEHWVLDTIARNLPLRPVYLADPDDVVREQYTLSRQGVLYRVEN